jgi:hypothetical protein
VAYISDLVMHGVDGIGNEVARDWVVADHIHCRCQEASDVSGDRVGSRIRENRILVVVDLSSVGNWLARSLVGKPVNAGTTISRGMSVPLDTIAMIRAIAKVPSGAFERLRVADFVAYRASGSGRLEVTEKRR